MFEGPDSSLARAYGEAVKAIPIELKAWMFITSDGQVITDLHSATDIYFKKPNPRPNPFDYLDRKLTWQPTPITITYQLPTPSKEKGNKAKNK